MNIGRHNYEEFFLLYADNELCAADRKAVEIFVAENADLKAELQLILQTVFNADDVVFENKAILLKEEISPLQEQLLLYADNELNAGDKQKIQELLNSNADVAEEFTVLQQTKLQPDTTIVFANKKILYQKAEGRVVRIGWLRVAAAAVLLGLGTWATFTLIKPAAPINESVVNAATQKNTVAPVNNNASTAAQAIQQQPSVITKQNNTAAVQQHNSAAANSTLPENNTQIERTIKQNAPQQKTDNNAIANKKPSNNLPEPLYNNINKTDRNETAIVNVQSIENATDKVNSGKTDLVASVTKPNTEAVNGYAINASFIADNANGDDENVEEEKTKRTKLGGFIRKVKRLVERNTNTKAGNSIKVAGFDIALNK